MDKSRDFINSDEIAVVGLDAKDQVLVELKDSIFYLTINRPEFRNAMNLDVMELLGQGMDIAQDNATVRVVVLQGSGDKAFCAGADLGSSSMMEFTSESNMIQQHEAKGKLPELFKKMWTLSKPVVAKVNGYAVAGGFGLALACDFIVASENSIFGATEINVGLWPFMISVPILRAIPPKIALELMMTGRRIDASEAYRIGFINRLCKSEQIDQTLSEFVSFFVNGPPIAIKLGKQSFYAVENMDSDSALLLLQSALSVLSYSNDAKEGIEAFRDKRKPNFKGN
jgi:enoyl-CoA hydratase/carnithine racemase